MTDEPATEQTGRLGLLIELAVGLVVLLGIAGLAIWNLPREHRRAGNEAAAVGALMKVCEHQKLFRKAPPAGAPRYAASLGELGAHALTVNDPLQAIDPVLATGTKQGYRFAITDANDSGWSATATPSRPGETGHRHFFVDQTGVVRYSPDGPADRSSLAWGELEVKWPSPQYDAERW